MYVYSGFGDSFEIVLIGFLNQACFLPCLCSCIVFVYVVSLIMFISLCFIWFSLAYSVLLIGSSLASACSSSVFLVYGYVSE